MFRRLRDLEPLVPILNRAPGLYVRERAWAAMPEVARRLNAWMSDEEDFAISLGPEDCPEIVVSNVMRRRGLEALVRSVPYGETTVFVFFRDFGWELEALRFDLSSLEIFAWLAAPMGRVEIETAPDCEATLVDAEPRLPEGLGEVLGADRHRWPDDPDPPVVRAVLHAGVEFRAYVRMRPWFDGFWDVDRMVAGTRIGGWRGVACLMESAAEGVRMQGGRGLISLVPPTCRDICRAARRTGWELLRSEIHVRRPVQP